MTDNNTGETPAATPADQAYRLDENESDPSILWLRIRQLESMMKGPDGFETWRDAAIDERGRRVKAEQELLDARQALELRDSTLAPTLDQLVTPQIKKAMNDARDLAMKNCVAARIPESGDFGDIAQNLDWALDELGRVSADTVYARVACGWQLVPRDRKIAPPVFDSMARAVLPAMTDPRWNLDSDIEIAKRWAGNPAVIIRQVIAAAEAHQSTWPLDVPALNLTASQEQVAAEELNAARWKAIEQGGGAITLRIHNSRPDMRAAVIDEHIKNSQHSD